MGLSLHFLIYIYMYIYINTNTHTHTHKKEALLPIIKSSCESILIWTLTNFNLHWNILQYIKYGQEFLQLTMFWLHNQHSYFSSHDARFPPSESPDFQTIEFFFVSYRFLRISWLILVFLIFNFFFSLVAWRELTE